MPALKSLFDVIALHEKERGEAVCIAATGREPLTYSHLKQQVEYMGATLRRLGIQKENRVAIVAPNGPEMALLFLGTACYAACAPLNHGYTESEFHFYLTDLDARLLIIQHGVAPAAMKAAAALNIPVLEIEAKTHYPAGMLWLGNEIEVSAGIAEANGLEDVCLILHTSGTTARPKIVPLSHGNLLASAGNIGRTLQISHNDRCLNIMPLFHIHGLMAGLTTSIFSGASVFCAPDFDSVRFYSWYDEAKPTWLTAVPTMLKAVLDEAARNAEVIEHHRLRLIRSSSSQMPNSLLEGLRAAFKVPVLESYGMTEACHQMASNPLNGTQKPGSVGIASGPEMAIMDEAGQLLGPGMRGEIVIRGANVTLGYDRNPEANAKAFQEGWFRTGDQGFRDEEGYFTLSGRLKELINRGGEKISPLEVDIVLQKHPNVAQAATFGIAHPTLGEVVVAAVVLRKGAFVTAQELQNFAAAELAGYKVPQQILILDAIPKGPTGKIQRNTLAEKLKAFLSTPVVEASDDRETQLVARFSRALHLPPDKVGVTSSFFSLGGDSLQAIRLLAELNEILGVAITPTFFARNPTVRGLIEAAEHLPVQKPARESQRLIGEVPLMAGVQELLELEMDYVPIAVLESRDEIRVPLVEKCMEYLANHHDVLRSTFRLENGKYRQFLKNEMDGLSTSLIDLSGVSRECQEMELNQEVQRLIRGVLSNLKSEKSPIQLAVVNLGEGKPKALIFAVHHAIIDEYSIGVITDDFSALYSQLLRGEALSLPARTTSIDKVAAFQKADSLAPGKDFSYWLNKPREIPVPPPTDRLPQPGKPGVLNTVSHTFDVETTRRLLFAPSARLGVNPVDLLLCAQARLMAEATRKKSVLVRLVTSGRTELQEQTDISRSVGLFMQTIPVLLEVDDQLPADLFVQSIVSQANSVPHRGHDYGYHTLAEDKTLAGRLRRPWGITHPLEDYFVFNYVGSRSNLKERELVVAGAGIPRMIRIGAVVDNMYVQSERARRPWSLLGHFSLVDGALNLLVMYNSSLYETSTALAFPGRLKLALEWIALDSHATARVA